MLARRIINALFFLISNLTRHPAATFGKRGTDKMLRTLTKINVGINDLFKAFFGPVHDGDDLTKQITLALSSAIVIGLIIVVLALLVNSWERPVTPYRTAIHSLANSRDANGRRPTDGEYMKVKGGWQRIDYGKDGRKYKGKIYKEVKE